MNFGQVNYQVQNNYNNVNNQQFNQQGNKQPLNQYGFSQNVQLKYTNPTSSDLNSGTGQMHHDFLTQLDKIVVPDLSNIQNILFACESTKNEYINYVGLEFKLDDMLKKAMGTTNSTSTNYTQQNQQVNYNNNNYQNVQNNQYQYNQGQNSQYNVNQYSYNNQGYNQNSNYGSGYQQGSNNYGGYQNSNSHLPTQSSINEKDIERFTAKFKCSREMAVTYLEAFGNYDEAESQFIINTGWKQ